MLPAHTEYAVGGKIADRISIKAATFVGPHDEPILNRTQLPVRGFTVDFTPLGVVELLGIPQGEIANWGIPAEELMPTPWVRELVERVNLTDAVPDAITAAFTMLRRALRNGEVPSGTQLVRRALQCLSTRLPAQRNGVEMLASRVGVTSRHLNREFHRHFGMSPRRYMIIRRVQCAMTELVEKPERGLTEVAGDAGLFDYPHFSREFKRLALTTPHGFRLEPQYREYQLVAQEPGRA